LHPLPARTTLRPGPRFYICMTFCLVASFAICHSDSGVGGLDSATAFWFTPTKHQTLTDRG